MHGTDVIALLTTPFWLWMLIDCILNRRLRTGAKLFWVLLILFTHIIGAAIYFFFGRKGSNSQKQKSYSPPPYVAPQQSPYHPYQQGYQTRQEKPYYQPSTTMQQESLSQHEQYEQPQAVYPEQTQEMP